MTSLYFFAFGSWKSIWTQKLLMMSDLIIMFTKRANDKKLMKWLIIGHKNAVNRKGSFTGPVIQIYIYVLTCTYTLNTCSHICCTVFLGAVLFLHVDALHAAVQPAGQAATAEVVHSHSWAWQEEDGQGADADSVGSQTKDVQFSRMARPQDCL